MIVLYHGTMYRPSFKQELDNVSFTQAVEKKPSCR